MQKAFHGRDSRGHLMVLSITDMTLKTFIPNGGGSCSVNRKYAITIGYLLPNTIAREMFVKWC